MAVSVRVKDGEAKPEYRPSSRSASMRLPYIKFLYKVALLIILAVLAIAVWLMIMVIGNSSAMSSINTKEYQAVFLTNGQAYFGKVKAINSNYIKLTNIYYLQASQSSTAAQSADLNSSQPTQLSLVKLGSEIHGPEDQMYVARPQVLFWENLKNSSKVVQAILKNQGQ